jgi:hypothetical protein
LRGSDEKFTDDCHWWSCEPKKNYLFVQLWSSILPHFEKSLRIAINKTRSPHFIFIKTTVPKGMFLVIFIQLTKLSFKNSNWLKIL